MVLTAQPRLRPLSPAMAERLATVRAGVDEQRLRQHVERLDAPRGRYHAAPAMTRAESYVAGELERAGWRVARREFTVPDEETGLHGSRALAGELDRLGGRPAAVVVFECIGFYSALPGSQVLPPGAGLVYPGQRRRTRQRGWRGDWGWWRTGSRRGGWPGSSASV